MNTPMMMAALLACLACNIAFAQEAFTPEAWNFEQDAVSAGEDSAAVEPAEPPRDAAGCLLAVERADDPATAEDAYQRGLQAGADRVTINQRYVRKMISLGLPGQAEEAAERVVEVFPQDGVAWAVLAYSDAARNDTTAALAELAMAVDWAADDPFVLGVAGKLMAWYRCLGDPSELPPGLPERLDEIHAQLCTRPEYRSAFEAAFAFYRSQAGAPIPERPQEVVEPAFENVVYSPAYCTTYNEYVYSGFVAPCFSASWLVPRVNCYVIHDRAVHRCLRFHIGDRCDRYHGGFHARRLHWESGVRCAGYHVSNRIRLAPPHGSHLPPVHARYTKSMLSAGHLSLRPTATTPPPSTPHETVTLHSRGLDVSKHGRESAPISPRSGSDARSPSSGFTPRSESPRHVDRTSPARTDVGPSSTHERPADRSTPGIDVTPRTGRRSSAAESRWGHKSSPSQASATPRVDRRPDSGSHAQAEPRPGQQAEPSRHAISSGSSSGPKRHGSVAGARGDRSETRPAVGAARPTSTIRTQPKAEPVVRSHKTDARPETKATPAPQAQAGVGPSSAQRGSHANQPSSGTSARTGSATPLSPRAEAGPQHPVSQTSTARPQAAPSSSSGSPKSGPAPQATPSQKPGRK